MASDPAFVAYVVDQLSALPGVHSRNMFGEYGLYAYGIYFGAVCDDRLLVKVTAPGCALVPDAPREEPYPGGSPMLRVDALVDDREALCALVEATCAALPAPKPKRKSAAPE